MKHETYLRCLAHSLTAAAACLLTANVAVAADAVSPPEPPPVEARSEGAGPYDRLILRGGYMVDGTGAPAQGPVDIVIENDRIVDIRIVGAPKLAIDPAKRPPLEGGTEIDLEGAYILPGFVDTHLHLHVEGDGQGVVGVVEDQRRQGPLGEALVVALVAKEAPIAQLPAVLG